MQPQGHLQVVVNLADYGMNPQSALDAPRWQFVEGNTVLLEESVPSLVMSELARRGHNVQVSTTQGIFGKGQIILSNLSSFRTPRGWFGSCSIRCFSDKLSLR